MKKLILTVLVTTGLFAGWYDDDKKSSNNDSYNNRGYEKPGDDNYNNQQIDEHIYGKDNHYQGSRPGDDDWGDRNTKQLMER